MLEFKPDWEASQARYRAFWAGEIIDRPLVQVTARKRAPRVDNWRVLPPETWDNPEPLLERIVDGMEATYYGGDALPIWWPNLGPTTMSAFMGCPIHFSESTSWQDPILDDLTSAEPALDEASPVWQATLDITRAISEQAAGRFLVGFSDYGMGADVLSHLRGPDGLSMDLIDCPEDVQRWMTWLTAKWMDLYWQLHAAMPAGQGTVGWLSAWAPGTTYPMQNDFSCMISADMYRECFLEEVQVLSRFLEYPAYHLDGPGAVAHLDALLEIPELRLIQWVPGEGNPNPVHWMPLLKRVRAAGKLLHLYGSPGDLEPLIEELGPEGWILSTGTATPEEADALVARAATLTRARAR